MLPQPVYETLYQQLLGLYAESFRDILLGQKHLEQMTHDSLSESRAAEALSLFEEQTGTSLRGKRMLEIGAGICMTLATARLRFGADAQGIEPGDDEYSGSIDLGRQLLRAVGLNEKLLTMGYGEALPYQDASFDVVFSSNVIEHVNDPAKVMAESLRVLRPGGIMYHVIPNYGSWWEGHYGVLWIPHLPKALGRLYLRLLGKKPAFLDTLQLINRGWMTRMLAPFRDQIDILGWGQELFEKRITTLNFTEYAALGRLKQKLQWIKRLGLLRALATIGKLLHWETPLVVIVRKKELLSQYSKRAA
jgi:SAM-dependent methyltransferase